MGNGLIIWEYLLVPAKIGGTSDSFLFGLRRFGDQGWEYVGRETHEGRQAYLFKRPRKIMARSAIMEHTGNAGERPVPDGNK